MGSLGIRGTAAEGTVAKTRTAAWYLTRPDTLIQTRQPHMARHGTLDTQHPPAPTVEATTRSAATWLLDMRDAQETGRKPASCPA